MICSEDCTLGDEGTASTWNPALKYGHMYKHIHHRKLEEILYGLYSGVKAGVAEDVQLGLLEQVQEEVEEKLEELSLENIEQVTCLMK